MESDLLTPSVIRIYLSDMSEIYRFYEIISGSEEVTANTH